MRASSQNNQFVFNFPNDFIPKILEDKYNIYMEKNFVPYDSVLDYINSTIKEIVFPSITLQYSEQILKRGKQISYKDAKNVHDYFNRELDITFRSVDSHINYFMMSDLILNFQLDNNVQYIPFLQISVLDKDGSVIYTINLKDVLFGSLSELRMSYNVSDFSEKTFSLSIKFNFIDILYGIDTDKNIKQISSFDIPFKPVDDRYVDERKKNNNF